MIGPTKDGSQDNFQKQSKDHAADAAFIPVD